MRHGLKALALVALLAGPMAANAVPILTATWVNNNQIWAPTDDIVMLVEITNSGDMAGSFNYAGVGFGDWALGPYGATGGTDYEWRDYSRSVAAGTSLVVEFFAIFGSADIPLRSYITGASNIGDVQLGSFMWTIAEIDVPEPSTLALFSLGLLGLGLSKWRKLN